MYNNKKTLLYYNYEKKYAFSFFLQIFNKKTILFNNFFLTIKNMFLKKLTA